MNVDMDLIAFTKTNSKLITDIQVKHKRIKLLLHKIREKSNNFGSDDDFIVRLPKTQLMQEIIDELDLIKCKNFCSAKETKDEKTSHRQGDNI